MDITKWGTGEGGYVFLAHSHDDIDRVRKIRNYLEEQGFEPLCFYLKCLEQDAEVFELVTREIDAREWFVYLDSPNARKSEWVAKELEYASRHKDVIRFDLEREPSELKIANQIMDSMRVFISCSQEDAALAKTIAEYLKSKDLKVFFAPESILAGADFRKSIFDGLREASKHGCVIVLLTESAIKSNWVKSEVVFAYEEGATLLPIFFSGTDSRLNPDLFCVLADKQYLYLNSEIRQADLDRLYAVVKDRLRYKGE